MYRAYRDYQRIEEENSYRPYRHAQRIEDPWLQLVRDHLREMDDERAATDLAQQAREGQMSGLAWLFAQARPVWHGLWARIRKQTREAPAVDQPLLAPEA
jgi:hypothetical protein